jgi:hypothetical protein
MSSLITPVNLEIFAVNSLIAGIGMTDSISSVSYYCTDDSLKYFHASSGTRENNFLIQVEIARHLAQLIGAEFVIRNSELIEFRQNEEYIVDVNAIRVRQSLPSDDILKLLAISPESMNPLLGTRFLTSIGIAKSRWKCFRNLYLNKSIPMKVYSFVPSRKGAIIEIRNILGESFKRRISDLASEFSLDGYSGEFSELWSNLSSNPGNLLVVVLPTPHHYGGTNSEDLLLARYLNLNFDPGRTSILIKNHPSDLVRHATFDSQLSEFSITYWDSELSRNLPIELLAVPFQDRMCLISSGSSAQYSIDPKSSRIVIPPARYARKLYKNIYGSLNLLFRISSI